MTMAKQHTYDYPRPALTVEDGQAIERLVADRGMSGANGSR